METKHLKIFSEIVLKINIYNYYKENVNIKIKFKINFSTSIIMDQLLNNYYKYYYDFIDKILAFICIKLNS